MPGQARVAALDKRTNGLELEENLLEPELVDLMGDDVDDVVELDYVVVRHAHATVRRVVAERAEGRRTVEPDTGGVPVEGSQTQWITEPRPDRCRHVGSPSVRRGVHP